MPPCSTSRSDDPPRHADAPSRRVALLQLAAPPAPLAAPPVQLAAAHLRLPAGFGSMEPFGFGGSGQHLQEHEECTGFVPWFGASSSCLGLLASVIPQDGLAQRSSLPALYNHLPSSNQDQYLTPSTNSSVEQPISMDCSRNYKEVRTANESDTDPEKLPMPHFEQQLGSGYYSCEDDHRESSGKDYSGDESDVVPEHQIAGEDSSWEDDTCPRMQEDIFVAGLDEDNNNQFYGNKSDTLIVKQPIQLSERDVVVGYSSAEDGPCKQIARWETTSPLAHNEKIMGAVEEAMRNSNDGTKEHMFLPKVGAIFPSLGDAFQFYNLYSWEVGFSIRIGTNKNGKKQADGTVPTNMMEYRCQRAGKPRSGTKFSTTLCGCPARLRLLRNKDNKYFVSIFVADHNHELVKSCGEKRHLKSHQSIDHNTKQMVRCLRENNVCLSKVTSIMGSMPGTMNNLNKKHMKTLCSEIAADLISDDIQKTMLSFMKLRDEDPNFVYSFQMDKDCRITSLMWSNGNSRKMYSHFGDVVTFDTTYKTNIYNMPFGMFVGVNNHFQSVIYAGVLLTSETTESFAWAFKTFVEMMGGKAPVTMLTDQAAAMGAALRQVLKNTKHRWCKWHVLKKLVEMLGHMFKNHKDFKDDFNKVVNHMLSVQEFEDSWAAFVAKYGLSGNPEVTRAFESRSMWAKAWFKDIFCARMTSTQRSESANNVLKHFVPRNSPINLFVQQYNKLVTEQEKADDEEEKNTNQREIQLKFWWPIESHAAKLYTRAAYYLFLEELGKTTQYIIVDNKEANVYKVVHVLSEHREKWSKVDFKVSVDIGSGLFDCECGLYNHFGILCCHALLVMVQKGVPKIPDIHIMKRWTRSARSEEPTHLLPVEKPSGSVQPKVLKRNMLQSTLREIEELADSDSESLDFAMKQATAMLKKLQEKRDAIRTTCQVGYESSGSEGLRGGTSGSDVFSDSEGRPLQLVDSRSGVAINLNSIKPPLLDRTMGRPSNVRPKGSAEVRIRSAKTHKKRPRYQASGAVKQSRHCKKCRSNDHDARRCPGKNPLSPVGEENDME